MIIAIVTVLVYSALLAAAMIYRCVSSTVSDELTPFEYFLAGPVSWAILAVAIAAHKIRHFVKYHNRRSLVQNKETGEIFHCDRHDFDNVTNYPPYSTVKSAMFENYRNVWGKDFMFAGILNTRYTPKCVWKQYPALPDEIAKEARRIEP